MQKLWKRNKNFIYPIKVINNYGNTNIINQELQNTKNARMAIATNQDIAVKFMILKIGHRGAMGYEPENTLRSFKKAIDLNVDMVELDVHLCKTGEIVVIHDSKVDRTTNGKGKVAEKTLTELKSMDAGKGETIPALSEVFDFIDKHSRKKCGVNIEIKGAGVVKPLSRLIEKYISQQNWDYNNFHVSSFNHFYLMEFKALNPKINIGALLAGLPVGLADFAERVNAYSANICAEFATADFINDAHKRGIKVFVWTVNDPCEIEKMKQLGVDGIVSNFPDRIGN